MLASASQVQAGAAPVLHPSISTLTHAMPPCMDTHVACTVRCGVECTCSAPDGPHFRAAAPVRAHAVVQHRPPHNARLHALRICTKISAMHLWSKLLQVRYGELDRYFHAKTVVKGPKQGWTARKFGVP